MAYDRTDFNRALRPFSLVVAPATTGLGISLAMLDGAGNSVLAAMILLAALLLQAGVNLINDYADLGQEKYDAQQRSSIILNARVGGLLIALGCSLGLWFVWLRGWPMLVLGAAGVFGAWNYASGPLNFKARGLGVIAVFFLTGVLMVEGAYFAMSGQFTLRVAWLSVPFSLYASLLLLANELRDFESDVVDGHGTFTVRYGYPAGVWLYRALTIGLVLTTGITAFMSGMALLLLPLLALALLWLPLRRLLLPVEQRTGLARLTGRCYLVYAVFFVSAWWVPTP